MNSSARKGMTLAELLIGFFLLISASILFIQTISGFKKETTFTSESFLAASLTEKVLEQCYQESELNPHGLQAIGLTDETGKPYPFSTFVTDKETVFFSNPAITDEKTPDLHDVLKDNFRLNVSSEKKPGFYEVSAGFTWKAQSGKGAAISSTRILSFTGEKEVLTTFSLDDDQVKSRLVKDIFNSPGSALSSKVSSINGEKLLIDIGHIYYSGLDWLNSEEFKEKYQKAASLETFTAASSDDYARCTQIYYEMARDLLHLMMSLKQHADDAGKNISFISSIPKPERFIIESRIERGGMFYRQLRRIFFNCLLRASERYGKQIQHSKNQRQQRQLIIRLVNISRILYENRTFCEEITPAELMARHKVLAERLKEAFQTADPSIYRLADQELSFISQNSLKQNFFMLKLTGELFKGIDDYTAILDPA
jgi:hypothetical protein